MTRGCRRVFTKKATCLTRTAHLSHLHLQVNFQFNNASKRPEKKRSTKSQKPFLCGMQGGPAKFPLNVTQLLVHFEVSWNVGLWCAAWNVGFWNVILNWCWPQILNKLYLFGSEIMWMKNFKWDHKSFYFLFDF